jgi:hypothetical protein
MRVATLTLMFLCTPLLAAAQGINLAWDDCTLGDFSHDESPACDTDIGPPFKLIVSVDPGGVIGDVNGAQGVIDFRFDAAGVPDFWRLDTGGCRQGNLAADVAVGSANAPFSCPEPWSQVGGAAGGANLVPFGGGPNRARITWIVAVPGTVVLDDGIAPDWYLIALNILRSGTTTCSGCLVPACIVANEVRLTKPANTPGGDVFIYGPAHSQYATWRGGGTLGCPGCPPEAYCPVENVTWGKVKAMFR